MDIIDTQKDIILKMGDLVETRSKETANHVYRVAEFSYMLAKAAGINDEQATIFRHASPMHDVGKVGIPDSILLKPGKLTREEFDVIKTHTTIGYNIFRNSYRDIIKIAATIAYEHHERWDGTGYPQQIKGEDIHIFGRISAIADVFDALLHKREYKEAWSADRVFSLIKEERGKQFDPHLVDVFFSISDKLIKINENYPD